MSESDAVNVSERALIRFRIPDDDGDEKLSYTRQVYVWRKVLTLIHTLGHAYRIHCIL
jgi:hypothetical protein